MWATCHTEGCVNAGAAVDVGDLSYTDDDGNPHTSTVLCGPCGQPIEDLSPTDPTPVVQALSHLDADDG